MRQTGDKLSLSITTCYRDTLSWLLIHNAPVIVLAQLRRDNDNFHLFNKCPQFCLFLAESRQKFVSKMRTRSVLYYLAVGFLIMGLFMEEVEARRKILRGRKTITRRYYRGTSIPAWLIAVLAGLGMLVVGGGLYLLLKKTIVDGSGESGTHSYHPAMQDEV